MVELVEGWHQGQSGLETLAEQFQLSLWVAWSYQSEIWCQQLSLLLWSLAERL